MKFTPNRNRIVIAPDAPPEKVGQIWMSETTKKRVHRPTTGVVIACGEVDDPYTQYLPGTRVVFHKDWQGTPVELEGHLYFIMHCENVFGHQEEVVNAD